MLKSRRMLKRFFAALLCLLALLVLAWAEEDWRSWFVWNRFKQAQEANGEKLDFKDFVPPQVPDHQNFALAPLIAGTYTNYLGTNGVIESLTAKVSNPLLDMTYQDENYWNADYQGTRLGAWALSKTTDLARWQNYYRWLPGKEDAKNFPIPAQPQSPAQDVLFALSQYDSEIKELRAAAELPATRFPLNYGAANPDDILLPHLPALRNAAQTLELRAIAELHNAESNTALADVNLTLQLARKIRSEPFVESQLTRADIANAAIQVIYEGLAAHKWSDMQLAEMDDDLSKLDFLADYEFAMRAENASRISEIEYFHRTRNFHELDNSDYVNDYSAFYKNFLPWAPAAIFYENELNVVRVHQQWVFPLVNTSAQMVDPTVLVRGMNETQASSPYNILSRMFFHKLASSMPKFSQAQAAVDLARTGIALERYRLANGNYPDSLDALAPKFAEKIPHDIFEGKPLHYRRMADGEFILYSIGWNEVDDGGNIAETKYHVNNFRKGDWVWKYPQQ